MRRFSRRTLLGAAAALPLPGAARPYTALDTYFRQVLDGYLRNARRTSDSFAVCDFEGGTILKNSIGNSGKTYDSVSRMLPAMAAWVAGNRVSDTPELLAVLRHTFKNAFDPQHPDYWVAPPPDRSNQRQVEASVVAWSLWLLRDTVLPTLAPEDRANIQAWLAACTQHPVRNNNWAWFTAVNQAVRLDLSRRFTEFHADTQWMLDDLKALDAMAAGDGWYSDSPGQPMYDYYNFWVFASHFLYWNRIAGRFYPEWSARFGARLRPFLEKAPFFFGANGSHVLFGRSLIYRFAVLTPLVLAHEQKLWPHSPGLLRRIVRRNLEFHWRIGCYDEARGKLRETYSAEGTPEIRDSYIDNGHPYWGMQAFALHLIEPDDPFWSAREEPLPVERGDFTVRFDALRMMLSGTRATGQVRWLLAESARGGPEYRDKYTKLSYSSHFPFNILKRPGRAAWDGTLVFRNPKTGACATRAGVSEGKLTPEGLETKWWAELDGHRIEVRTRIRLSGEFERHNHEVTVPASAAGAGIEIVEGSYPLGLAANETCRAEDAPRWLSTRSAAGHIVSWNVLGYEKLERSESFEETGRRNVNVIYPRMVVNTLRRVITEPSTTVASLHYASPRPLARAEFERRALTAP